MMDKIMSALTSKLATAASIWILSILMVGVGTIVSLGKTALEDNTLVLSKYEHRHEEITNNILELQIRADNSDMLMFKDKLRTLAKQTYKMSKDPDDIKPIDVESASDFCASPLFKTMAKTLLGSDMLMVDRQCVDVNNWVVNNPG